MDSDDFFAFLFFLIIACALAAIIALATSIQDYTKKVDNTFKKADANCRERGGADAYDVEDQNYLVYQCKDGRGRIARLYYIDR